MWPDRVSNPGPLTYESGALPTALRDLASYKTDLAFLDCFGRSNQHLVAKEIQYAIRYKAKSIITGMHLVSGLNVCVNRKQTTCMYLELQIKQRKIFCGPVLVLLL